MCLIQYGVASGQIKTNAADLIAYYPLVFPTHCRASVAITDLAGIATTGVVTIVNLNNINCRAYSTNGFTFKQYNYLVMGY